MNQLASINSLVTKDDAMAMLLKGMPKEYGILVTTLKYGLNPTFEGIISALQEEERKKLERKDDCKEEQSITTTFKDTSLQACKNCGKVNHDEKDCFHIKPCGMWHISKNPYISHLKVFGN